jgi:glycosyltransferase involved in cell wall biosynthesis
VNSQTPRPRRKVLIVGAFPQPGSKVVGGVLRNCEILVQSAFSSIYDLSFVDTTQRSNPPPPLLHRVFYAVGRWKSFIQTLLRHRPDYSMIFCGTGLSLVEKGLMAVTSRIFGARAVVFPMGGQMIHQAESSKRLQWWYRLWLQPANTLLCQGPIWTRFLTGKLGIRADKLVIVNSWTATPELLAIGAKRRFASRAEAGTAPVKLVFIGWLEREKGILELMNVFAKIAPAHRVTLSVIGGGSLEPVLAAFVAAHGLADRVTLHGWLSTTAVAGVLADSDVFVLPSWGEGIPNSLIEAMSTKVPAIITRVGTIPDFVVDGESGLLITPRSEEDLERALVRMVTDRDLRIRCAENAYATAKAQLSIDNAIEQMKPAFAE